MHQDKAARQKVIEATQKKQLDKIKEKSTADLKEIEAKKEKALSKRIGDIDNKMTERDERMTLLEDTVNDKIGDLEWIADSE